MANFDDNEIIAMLANITKSPNGCLSEGQLSETLFCYSKNSFTLTYQPGVIYGKGRVTALQ